MLRMLDDLVWAYRMLRARRIRRGMLFSRRERHSKEFTRILDGGARVAWPDGVFHMRKDDFERAEQAALTHPVQSSSSPPKPTDLPPPA